MRIRAALYCRVDWRISVENENKEENCFCGEIWSASEMEMTKDDYFNKR